MQCTIHDQRHSFQSSDEFHVGFFSNMQACQMIGGESREYACQNPRGSIRVNPKKIWHT